MHTAYVEIWIPGPIFQRAFHNVLLSHSGEFAQISQWDVHHTLGNCIQFSTLRVENDNFSIMNPESSNIYSRIFSGFSNCHAHLTLVYNSTMGGLLWSLEKTLNLRPHFPAEWVASKCKDYCTRNISNILPPYPCHTGYKRPMFSAQCQVLQCTWCWCNIL